MGFLGYTIVLFLAFYEISILFSIEAVSIYIPANRAEDSLFSIPSPALFVDFFDDSHSHWCEVLPHCSFDLHFSTNY